MRTRNLTARLIESTTFPEDAPANKRIYIWDSKEPGLGLAVYRNSKKFVLRYRDENRRQRIVTLGPYGKRPPLLNVPRARAKAAQERGRVVSGANPAVERRTALTFEDLARRWLSEYARPRLRTAPTADARIERHLVPEFGRVPATELRRSALIALHTRIGTDDCRREKGCMNRARDGACSGHPKEANRVIQLVSRIFNWGLDAKLLPERTPNPASRFGKYRFKEPKKKRRAATVEEIGRLKQHMSSISSSSVRTVYWLLLLTGCRKGELLGLEWSRVNLNPEPRPLRDRVVLPPRSLFLGAAHNKSNRDFTLPLSGAASALLGLLPSDGNNPWVFPAETQSGHLEHVDRQWQRLRRKAGFPGLTLHDLRATVATWARNDRREPEAVIRAMLNHAPPEGITQRYLDDVPLEDVRRSFEEHANAILEAAGVDNARELVLRDQANSGSARPDQRENHPNTDA